MESTLCHHVWIRQAQEQFRHPCHHPQNEMRVYQGGMLTGQPGIASDLPVHAAHECATVPNEADLLVSTQNVVWSLTARL
jgi:hypothetical protein